jgi:transcriptional regulator with XRE-family HTH domain
MKNEISELIKERLEALLEKRGLTRRQLADRIKITENHLNMMIRGDRNWKVSNLKKVADALEVSLDALVGETCQLPLVAEIGGGKEKDGVSFHYKAVVLPSENPRQVPCPEFPKGSADKTYVVDVNGTGLMPDLPPDSRLYIARGQGDAQNLKDGDLAIYVLDEDQRGYICRIERRDPEIHFHSFYSPPEFSEKVVFKKFTETIGGIDVVVAIVLRPDLLHPDLLVSK